MHYNGSIMRFPLFGATENEIRILVVPDGITSTVFSLGKNNTLERSVVTLDVLPSPSDTATHSFAPWLAQPEQFFSKIKELFPSARENSLTVAFPAGVCRFVSMPFEMQRWRPSDRIEDRELHGHMYGILQAARDQLRKQLTQEGGGHFVLADAILADIKIDGFSVHNPVGLSGTTVYGKLLAVFIDAEAATFGQRLGQELRAGYTHQTAFAALIAPTFAPIMRNDKTGCGVFLRDRATDILIFSSGALQAVHTISLGRNVFSSTVANAFSLPDMEAEEVLAADAAGILSKTMKTKISKVLSPATHQWLSALEIIFSNHIQKNDGMPSRFVFSGNVSYPRDVIATLGLSGDNRSSRAVISPDNLLIAAANKELVNHSLSNLVASWVSTPQQKKSVVGPALTLKVASGRS